MTRVQCLCGADLAISEASSGVVMRVEPHSCAGFSPLNATDARPGDALRDLFREHGFGGSIIERDVLAVVEANPGRDTGSSVCEWCKDWTPTVENPCAYCGRDDYTDRLCAKEADEYARPDHPSHATPDRAADGVWTPDPREGVWTIVLVEDGSTIYERLVFVNRDHAERWAQMFNESSDVRARAERIPFLRPPGWNFDVR